MESLTQLYTRDVINEKIEIDRWHRRRVDPFVGPKDVAKWHGFELETVKKHGQRFCLWREPVAVVWWNR
jgi:hypothetical protein